MSLQYDTKNIYASLMTAVRQVFSGHSAVLFLPNEGGDFFLAAFSCPDQSINTSLRIEPGKGLVGWIVRNRRPLIVNDFDRRSSHIGYYEPEAEERITAFMGYPLDNGAIICVDLTREGSFSVEDLEKLLSLGELVNMPQPIYKNDDEDVRRYFVRIERIQQLRLNQPKWRRYLPAFLKLVSEATRFDMVAFASRLEGEERYSVEAESIPLLLEKDMPEKFPLSGSVVGWVFRNDVPVHTDGLQGGVFAPLFGKIKGIPEFQAMICLPLSINKVTSAALCLGAIEARTIPQSMRSFLRMASDEMIQFLESLYLRHRIKNLLPKARVHSRGATAYNPDAVQDNMPEEQGEG